MLTNMPHVPLQTLPAFVAIARRSTLRAAAEALNLTHSALSQQMRVLEEQVGVPLFERRGRRLVLNAAGQALLQAAEPALERIAAGVRAAALLGHDDPRVHLTVVPSFAQRWLLPRMGRWRARHPEIAIELHTSQQIEDLLHGSFHAAVRQGRGPWRGLVAERLMTSPWVAVGSPRAGARLAGQGPAALAGEPLLGSPDLWPRWFEQAGVVTRAVPVATFNDAGLMLQAAEQDLGIALARELLAADALREGRLHRLSPLQLPDAEDESYWFVHAESLAGWGPLQALRDWLFDEFRLAQEALASAALNPAGTGPAGR